LVVVEPRRDFSVQGIVLNDLHALVLRVLPSDVRFVLGFLRIVRSPYLIAVKFL